MDCWKKWLRIVVTTDTEEDPLVFLNLLLDVTSLLSERLQSIFVIRVLSLKLYTINQWWF